MSKMTYDKNVGLPDVTKTISDILLQIKEYPLKSGESLFIEDFPVEAIASLCSAIISHYCVAVPTKADSVYGGAGVRIMPLGDLKDMSVKADKTNDIWYQRVSKWFGVSLDKLAFYWDKKAHMVRVFTADDKPTTKGMVKIDSLLTAFCFMCEEGKEYRAGYTEPTPAMSSGQSSNGINVWVGYNQVVWGYDEESDTVQQFGSRADATSHPIDAPLFAWLGSKAAAAMYKPAIDADDWTDL